MPVIEQYPGGEIGFDCPGCGLAHVLPVRPAPSPSWEFDGDFERPTLHPSILARNGCHVPGHKGDCWCNFEARFDKPPAFQCGTCHSFVRNGQIEFLNDCSHALAGRTVPLKPIEKT